MSPWVEWVFYPCVERRRSFSTRSEGECHCQRGRRGQGMHHADVVPRGPVREVPPPERRGARRPRAPTAARRLFIGTLRAPVTPTAPTRYETAPAITSAGECPSGDTSTQTTSTTHAAAVPNSARHERGVTASDVDRLHRGDALRRRAAGRAPPSRRTRRRRSTPPTSPQPRAASSVSDEERPVSSRSAAVPGATRRGGRVAGVVGEVARLAAERPLHAVGQRGRCGRRAPR